MSRSFARRYCRPSLSLILVVGLLAVAGAATAGQLDEGQIPAGAKWVVHFDGQAMRGSHPGKLLRAKWLSHEKVKKHLADVAEKIGMDPSQDIVDVTLYNGDFKKDRGVILMEVAKIDGEKALAHVREKHPDVRMSTYEGHHLFTWKMPRSKGGQDYITSTLYKGSIIVMSSEMPKVMEALDVLAGKSPSLSDSSQLAADVPAGTIVLVRAIDIKGAKLPKHCQCLKNSESLSFAAGQDGDMLFSHTKVTTESEEVAKNIAAVVNGFRALGALRFSGEKEILGMIAGLETSVDGKVVSMDWQGKSDATIQAVIKLKKKHHAKHGKHGWWKKHHKHKKDKDA